MMDSLTTNMPFAVLLVLWKESKRNDGFLSIILEKENFFPIKKKYCFVKPQIRLSIRLD